MATKISKWALIALAFAGVALVGPLPDAQAILTIRAAIDGGAFSLNVLDNNAAGTFGGTDLDPTIGRIALGTTTTPINFGGLQVFGSVSTSNSPGSPSLGQVASQSLNVLNQTGATHTVLLQISDNNFTNPPTPLNVVATASGTFSPVAGSGMTTVDGDTARARAWIDSTNTLFGMQTLVQDFTQPPSPGAGLLSFANSSTLSGFFDFPPPGYSMTVELNYTLANNTQLNSRSNVIQTTPIPEPSTVLMGGAALALLVPYLRRRRATA